MASYVVDVRDGRSPRTYSYTIRGAETAERAAERALVYHGYGAQVVAVRPYVPVRLRTECVVAANL